MKKETADLICKVLDGEGAEFERRDDYSGRGMYGNTTVGIVVGDLATFIKAVALASAKLASEGGDFNTFASEASKARTDNMGKSDVIFY